MAVPPERGPGVGQHGKGHLWIAERLHVDLGDGVLEAVVANVRLAAESLAIDAHQVAARVVVDHRLVGLAVFGAAEEQAAVGAEVVLHLDNNLEVAEVAVGEDDAAVARLVLRADDRAVLHDPAASRCVLARTTVARLGAHVPALKRLAVEEIDPAVLGRLRGRNVVLGSAGRLRLSRGAHARGDRRDEQEAAERGERAEHQRVLPERGECGVESTIPSVVRRSAGKERAGHDWEEHVFILRQIPAS